MWKASHGRSQAHWEVRWSPKVSLPVVGKIHQKIDQEIAIVRDAGHSPPMPDNLCPAENPTEVANPSASLQAAGWFPDTQWSIVMAAKRGDCPDARKALEQLCRDYWYPLYTYARWRGLTPHDAEDRTQDLFSSLIELDSLQSVAREKGRLRAFFLGAMKNVIAKEHRRQSAEKRGPRMVIASIDQVLGEKRLAAEPWHNQSPDVLFDQSWAYAVLDNAMRSLEAQYARIGRAELFLEIRPFLAGRNGDSTYTEVAAKLDVSETALRGAICQMRNRYRELIEEEIAQTLTSRTETKVELEYLQRVLAGMF